jgi:multiple sugar transport system permease protein
MARSKSSILLLLVPFAVFFVSFTVPLIWGILLSLYDSEGLFVGLANYVKVVKDASFWSSITFTLVYSACVTLVMTVLGFFIALAVNQLRHGVGVAKTVMLIPWAISLTAWGLLMQIITSGSFGILNDLLLRLGIIRQRISWLGDPDLARLTVIASRTVKDVWFSTLLFLVARQTLPEELYEEGKVSGANPLQAFWYITVPLLRTTMMFVVVFVLIFALQEFDMIYALTRGGPGFATEVAALSIYRFGIQFGRYEMGTALTAVWSLLISLFVVLVFGRVLIRTVDKR